MLSCAVSRCGLLFGVVVYCASVVVCGCVSVLIAACGVLWVVVRWCCSLRVVRRLSLVVDWCSVYVARCSLLVDCCVLCCCSLCVLRCSSFVVVRRLLFAVCGPLFTNRRSLRVVRCLLFGVV